MHWRGGASIDDAFLINKADRYIRRYNNPTILAWFGTCKLTQFIEKRKKYIDLAPELFEHNYYFSG